MKKMKLLLLGIFATFASTTMAEEVNLTANDATNKSAGWTLQLKTPKEIAGWQMKIALPDGITIPSTTETVGGVDLTVYDVTLPARYGSKYKAVGTPVEGGVFLFFIPVAETYTASDLQITGTDGDACTITLQASNFAGPATISITNICASDANGNQTGLSGEDKTFAVNHPAGDATSDFLVDGSDIQMVINHITAGTYTESVDVTNDGAIDGSDIQKVINVIIE
jgi:uncharacterized protein YcnI